MAIYIPGQGPRKGDYFPTEAGIEDYGSKRLGTYHMSDEAARQIYEPLRTNNFEFQVSGLARKLRSIDAPVYFKDTALDGDLYSNAEEVIRISVDQAFIPHFAQLVVSIKRGNSTLKYAGQPTFNNGQIRIKDYIGINAKMALMEWQNLSYNVKTEKIGLAYDYKIDAVLTEYTPDYIPVRLWKLFGCWISNLTESPFDSSLADNINSITATIEFDRALPMFDEEN